MKVSIKVETDFSISKNNKFIGRTKKVLSEAYLVARSVIEYEVTKECNNKCIKFRDKEKVWVRIFVEKRPVGDCHNLIEGILDAIKKAIDVDDKYFSVVCDYINTKSKEKYTYITIEQEDLIQTLQ